MPTLKQWWQHYLCGKCKSVHRRRVTSATFNEPLPACAKHPGVLAECVDVYRVTMCECCPFVGVGFGWCSHPKAPATHDLSREPAGQKPRWCPLIVGPMLVTA